MPLDYIEFSKKIKQKYPQYKDVDDMLLAQKMVEKYPEYKNQVEFKQVKKKSSTGLPSQPQEKSTTSATVKTTTQKPSVSSGGKKVDIFTGLPGKENNQYRVINNQWQRKEPNKDWTTVRDANAILYLNKHYKKNITPNEGFEGISSKLVTNNEETVANYLKKNYGHLGFKFEESGVGKDRITVLTEDGRNSETFYLDNWTDDEDASEAIRMKAWLKENIKTSDRERYNKIQEQMAQVKNVKPKEKVDFTKDAFANQSAGLPADLSLDIKQQLKVKELEKEAMEYNRSRMNTLVKDINEAKKTSGKYDDEFVRARVAAVYGNKDEIAQQNRYIKNNLEDIARANKYVSNKVYQYEQEKTKLDEEIAANGGILSPEMEEKQRSLEGMAEIIKSQSEDLKSSINTAKKDQNKINEIAGEYMLFKEAKGTVGGGIVNNFLKGATNIARFAGMSRQGQEELIKLIGSDYTENEFTTSAERSDIEKVLFSLSNSIGAAVGGAGVATAPSFFAQSYYELKDQMDDDPNFDSVPELEKTLLASTYGIAIGALEKFGLDVIASKTPLGKSMSGTVNKILASTIKGLPKGAGAEVLEEAINKNIKTLIAKGAINVVGGSIVEGATEFTQELAGGSIKELYNTMKEKEMFKSPESILSQAYEAAWLGALGGAVMQTPVQAVNAIATGLSNKNATMAEILEKAVTDSELRSMMTTSIKSKIVAGEINSEEGKKQLEAVNQAAGVFQKMPDNLTQEDKSVSFDLMIERSKIEKEIEGKDENLVAAQKARIAEINNQLKTISENAVQKQAAGEVPVQPEAAVSGEMAQGEPQAEPQVVTEEGQEKESVTQIFAAPLYSTTINTIEDAKSIRESGTHEQTVKAIDSISSVFGIPIEKMENSIGGYTMDDTGDSIVEISYAIKTKPVKNLQEIEGITAVMGALMPQVQESTIAAREVDESDPGFTGDNGVIRYDIKVDNIQGALDSLKAAGINDFSINENTGIVSLLDFSKGLSNETIEKINIFDKELKNRNVKYSEPRKQALESVLIDRDRRKVIISDLIRNTIQQGQQGSDYYNALIEAAKRDAEFKNETVDIYLGKELYDEIQQETRVKPGNRLFNEPLKEVREIANRYYERVFGSKRPIFEGTAELDVERAKRIASAFEQMKHDPKNPEVKKAYEALSKETIDQYKDFLDAGYVVEINNEEPYGNSQEMIDDLKNNKRIKIFSTEAGFGDMPITDQQRSDNPLLATTEFTDVNGQPMLVNDIFRAIHDFYGHAELGNSFGPKGEENAWNVHARMFSPLARKAMTTETRGQNSWVNFSGFNDEIQKLRDKAASLRDSGKIEEAQQVVDEIYEKFRFADQKIGLLPDEFSNIEEDTFEDIKRLDTTDKTNLQKVQSFLDKLDNDLEKFGKETLGINLPVAVARAVIKTLKGLVNAGISLEQALKQAAEIHNVTELDIVESFEKIRKKETKASKAAKKISKPTKKKVIVNEMAALRDQLKFEARAARQSQQDLKKRQRELIVTVNNMKRSGTITASQASALAKKITYLNVYNPVMVDRFLQYADRLFKNAEYQTILSEAFKVRKAIKNFMKNNQANVTAMAKDFGKINPAMVEDIEKYLNNAEYVLNAVKRSKQNTDFPIKNAADIDVITKYTEDMLEKQEEQLKNEKLKEYQDLVDQGILSGDMTLKEINEIIKAIEEEGPKNRAKQETELRRFLNTRFEMYSTIVKSMLRNNLDPFTGDTVEISDKDKEVLKRLLKVNLDDMSVKNAYTIVESMDNFIVNGITDGLDGAISAYEGDIEAKKLVKEGMKADKIRGLLFGLSPVTGRAIYENFATLPVLFDSLFKGVKSGMKVMDSMGFNLLSRGFAKATKIYNNAINDYGDKFSKSKPNDQEFNTSFNAYERGMLAYLKRTVPGNETAQKAEFRRRVGLIRESIQSLREYGNEDQQKMPNIYEEVYTKLGLDNADITIDQVQSNVDPKNAEAVNWWIDQWSQHYSDLYDVSLDVYNTKLGKDINYTTDRYSRVDGERELVDEATGNIGAFALDLGLTSYKDKAGVLMESNKNFKSLDTGKKSSTRFVNLDFDVSNASALRSALIDVNTASAVRRVDAFLNSKSYDKLFAEEKDAKILKRRVQNYILRYKNKVAFSDPTLGELDKYMDMVASIGATRALGGPSQAVLQTVPVFLSTLTNAGVKNMDFKGLVSDTDFHTWLNNSGYAIANRGMETSTAIESANKYLDKVAETKGEKFFKGVMKLNEFWLKTFLSQPDVWIARNSWKTYYTQSLREQGLYNGDIDWTTHEINEEAADYAQHMVDRQQNVSDAAMMGDFMNSQQPVKKIVRKVVLPFANFIMNQKTRLYSDIRTLSSETHTKGDKRKAWLSIGGLMTEISAYNAISYALKLYVYDTIAAAFTDYEDDEEEKKKNKQNRMKFVAQNVVKDIFSPLPVADGVTIQMFNFIADKIQDKTMSQDEINKAVEERNIYLESRGKEKMTAKEKEKFVKEFIESQKMVFEEYETKKWIDLGTATIAIEKARELYKMIDMSVTGKFKEEFNKKEVEKVILPDNMGDMKTATTLSALYNLGLLPREFNSVANSMKKYIEKNAISESQLEDYKTIKKEFGDVDGYKKGLLKSKMKIDNVMNEIRWVEENGGLTKEQSEEYNKLREVQGKVYIEDLKKIQKGIKAEKIYKRGN